MARFVFKQLDTIEATYFVEADTLAEAKTKYETEDHPDVSFQGEQTTDTDDWWWEDEHGNTIEDEEG